MHARVLRAAHQHGTMPDGLEIFQQAVSPEVAQLPGFQGMLLLSNRETHQSLTITLWETEAAMKAGEASGVYHAQVAKVAHLFSGAPIREEYEVRHLELAPGVGTS